MAEPAIDGLDPVIDRIVEQAEELAYVTLTDRTDSSREVKIGRLDATPGDLGTWLDEELTEDGPPDFVSPAQLDPDVLERALRRWATQTALSHAFGGDVSRFRLRGYAVKGYKMVAGGCFAIRMVEPVATAETAVATRETEPASFIETFEELEIEGARAGMHALGGYYAQWGQMMLSSMRQVQGVHQDMIDGLHKQVGEGRSQVEELLGALLETRAAASLSQVQQDTEVRRQQTNTMLAQQAIHGIGEAAKAFAVAKSGIDPALAGVAEKLTKSPELLETLQSSEVQALMEDADNLKMVAQMLRQAAQAAQAVKAAQAAKSGTEAGV